MKPRLPLLLAALACVLPLLPAREPANLTPLKEEIRHYVDSGDYDREIATVATDAKAWLKERAPKGGGKLAIVFDLDETLLSNWPETSRQDFGGERKALADWFEAAGAPAIAPVRELYLLARQLGVAVIYLTGRPERFRAATERNLQAVACGEYAVLRCKPNDWKETTGKFKVAERQRLTAEGYVIIANVGDQASDLEGGNAERTFKLPNPFYLTK